MSSSIPGPISLPSSPYDLSSYYGRVRQSLDICDPRTLFTSDNQLRGHVNLLSQYKNGIVGPEMNEELWRAKKVVDATLHPDTGEKVLLPFRMSAFVFSNLVVTAGMLTPNMSTRAMLLWQITNQSLNVAINASNANKSTPLSLSQMATSYLLAVSSSCGVALGLNSLVPRLKNVSPSTRVLLGRLVPFAAVVTAGVVNVGVMRGQEIVSGIDVYPSLPGWKPKEKNSSVNGIEKIGIPNSATISSLATTSSSSEDLTPTTSLGKSRHCALLAVSQTALSRVLNATPIMVIPPLVLLGLQNRWSLLKRKPGMVLPVNLAVIFITSVFALPLALGAFPTRQKVRVEKVEEEVRGVLEGKWKGRGGEKCKEVEFNRGI